MVIQEVVGCSEEEGFKDGCWIRIRHVKGVASTRISRLRLQGGIVGVPDLTSWSRRHNPCNSLRWTDLDRATCNAARDDCRAAPKSARCANDNEDCAKEDATVDAAVAVEEGLAAGGTGVCRCDDDGGGRRSGRRWSSPLLRSPPPPPPPSSSSSSL